MTNDEAWNCFNVKEGSIIGPFSDLPKTIDEAFNVAPDYQGIYTEPETPAKTDMAPLTKERRDEIMKEMGTAYADLCNATLLSALESQVGGDHYKNQGIQPFEITYKNFGYEGLQAAVYTKVNKYLTRDKGDHQENVEKAIHCLQIQLDYCKMTKDEAGNV